MQLVFGAGKHDRIVDRVKERLSACRDDASLAYLDYEPVTPASLYLEYLRQRF